MSLVVGDPNVDFFEQNPVLRHVLEFKNLIRDYPKEEASKIAWAVFMIEEVDSRNQYYRMPREDRVKEVKAEYFDIDMKKHKDLLSRYARLTMEKEEAMFKVHMDKMDDITAHLKDLDLADDKEFNKILKIMDKLPKMWQGLETVKNRMIDKKNKSVIRGGAKQSARERRTK